MESSMRSKEDKSESINDCELNGSFSNERFSPLSDTSSSCSYREHLSAIIDHEANLPVILPVLTKEDVASCFSKELDIKTPFLSLKIESSSPFNNIMSNNSLLNLEVSPNNNKSPVVNRDHIENADTMGNTIKKVFPFSRGSQNENLQDADISVGSEREKFLFEDCLNYEISDIEAKTPDFKMSPPSDLPSLANNIDSDRHKKDMFLPSQKIDVSREKNRLRESNKIEINTPAVSSGLHNEMKQTYSKEKTASETPTVKKTTRSLVKSKKLPVLRTSSHVKINRTKRKSTQNHGAPLKKLKIAINSQEMKKVDIFLKDDNYYDIVRLLIHQKSDLDRSMIGMTIVNFLIEKNSYTKLILLLQCLKEVGDEVAALCSLRICVDMIIFYAEKKNWDKAYVLLDPVKDFLNFSLFKPYFYDNSIFIKLAVIKVYFYNGRFENVALILREEKFFIGREDFHLRPADLKDLSNITRQLLFDYYFRNNNYVEASKFFYDLVASQKSLRSPIGVTELYNMLCTNLCTKNHGLEALKLFIHVHKLDYAESKFTPVMYRTLIHTAIENRYDFIIIQNVIEKATELRKIYPKCIKKNTITLTSYMSREEVYSYIIAWSHFSLFNFNDFSDLINLQLKFEIIRGDIQAPSFKNPGQSWDINTVKSMVSKIAKIEEEKLFKPSLIKSQREKKLIMKEEFNFKFLISAHKIWTGEEDYKPHFDQNLITVAT